MGGTVLCSSPKYVFWRKFESLIFSAMLESQCAFCLLHKETLQPPTQLYVLVELQP